MWIQPDCSEIIIFHVTLITVVFSTEIVSLNFMLTIMQRELKDFPSPELYWMNKKKKIQSGVWRHHKNSKPVISQTPKSLLIADPGPSKH